MFFHKFDSEMDKVKADIDLGKPVQIVDVRFDEEYVEGHLPHAILIPLPQLEELANQYLKKDITTYVYCRSGQRATNAVKKLEALGYTDVCNVGGIIHWHYEVEKGK